MIILCFSAIMHWVLIKMINIDIREHLFLKSLPIIKIKDIGKTDPKLMKSFLQFINESAAQQAADLV